MKLNAEQKKREVELRSEKGDTVTLQCGMLVACFLTKCRDEIPQIGKIHALSADSPEVIEVEWMMGSFSSAWKVCKQRQGRECIPWRESIQRKDIVFFPIQLTDTFKLRKETIAQLKHAYSLVV